MVRRITHRVGVVRDGRLHELAPTAELFSAPREDYTRELLAAVAGTRSRKAEVLSACPSRSRCSTSPRVPAGGTASDALRNSVDLAQAAERAGYLRYWVAEHHLNGGVASASTPVLVALLTAATGRIRVGSGATQLPHTSPLQAAEQFGTIAALHPGRVDLGLGRFDLQKLLALIEEGRAAPGAAPPLPPSRVVDGLLIPSPGRFSGDLSLFATLAALLGVSADSPAHDYYRQVADILSYVDGTAVGPDGVPLHVLPAEGADLDVWVLGSSPGAGAQAAGALGLPFAASYHTVPHTVIETVEAYRAEFRPSARLDRPHVMVSADVVVADDDERARDLAAPYGEWVLGIRAGRGALPYRTPGQARAREWTPAERMGVADRVDTQFVGSPATVADGLATLVRATGADELLVTTITTEHADRVAGHTLLADEWANRAATSDLERGTDPRPTAVPAGTDIHDRYRRTPA